VKANYHHGDLRRALIDASISLIEQRGIEALSLREVARVAGVSTAAPYHHFANKAELLGAIAARGFAGLTEAMQAAIASADAAAADGSAAAPDPLVRLGALGRAYVDFACARPTEFRLMFRPALVGPSDLPDDCDPQASFMLLFQVVVAVHAQLPESPLSPEQLTLSAWSLVHGAADLLVDGPLREPNPYMTLRPDQVGAAVVATIMTLLGAVRGT
jgi:AcrR family transcriptional regulator